MPETKVHAQSTPKPVPGALNCIYPKTFSNYKKCFCNIFVLVFLCLLKSNRLMNLTLFLLSSEKHWLRNSLFS